MANFFRGTAQSTPFQQAIEKVTDGSQTNEDWGTIMKICDHVGLHEERFLLTSEVIFNIHCSCLLVQKKQ